MNEVYKTLDEAKDICLQRMKNSSDDEAFKSYADALGKISNSMNELEKNEIEKEIEAKKIELETKKLEASSTWKDPKFLITIGVPILTMVISKIIDRRTLFKQTEVICKFEKDNIITSSAGKGLLGSVRVPSIFNKGDH